MGKGRWEELYYKLPIDGTMEFLLSEDPGYEWKIDRHPELPVDSSFWPHLLCDEE